MMTETGKQSAERGQALYDTQIRAQVEAEHRGKFLVLDVNTGDYEIDAEDLIACHRLLERRPDAVLLGFNALPFCLAQRLVCAAPMRARASSLILRLPFLRMAAITGSAVWLTLSLGRPRCFPPGVPLPELSRRSLTRSSLAICWSMALIMSSVCMCPQRSAYRLLRSGLPYVHPYPPKRRWCVGDD